MYSKDVLALNKLIVNNKEFEMLNAKLNIFNPFKVLKIDTFEIRHSNVIAWLLSPNGNHGLEDKVLKKVLSEIILKSQNVDIKKSAMEIYLGDFLDTVIFREWNHIDIMAVSEKNKIVLLIENKIYSSEHDNQLTRYLCRVKEEYDGYDIIPVYLTLEGDNTIDDDKWETFDYGSIYRILKNLIKLYKDNLNDKIIDFIGYYLKTLEDITMQDEEVVNLCKMIYNKNKEAIDLIIKYGKQSAMLAAGEEFVEKNKNIINTSSNNNVFVFIPKEFIGRVPEIKNKNSTYDNHYIEFYFSNDLNTNKLWLYLEIEPFDNTEIRLRFMEYLKKENLFKIPEKALTTKSKYTKIYSESLTIKDWDDKDLIFNAMKELYENRAKESKDKIVKAVNKFDLNDI